MDKSKRLFLKGAAAVVAAPAVVKAEHMMKLWVPDQEIIGNHVSNGITHMENLRVNDFGCLEAIDPNKPIAFKAEYGFISGGSLLEHGNEPWNSPDGYLYSDRMSNALREELQRNGVHEPQRLIANPENNATKNHIQEVIDYMKSRDIPPVDDDGNYRMLVGNNVLKEWLIS